MLYKRVTDSKFIFLITWSIWQSTEKKLYLLDIFMADSLRT